MNAASIPMDEIETEIVRMLRAAPMKQTEIVDAFPMHLYMQVGSAVRDLAHRGIVLREKSRATYIVRLNEQWRGVDTGGSVAHAIERCGKNNE